jgi:hypothetical protein
MSNNKIEKKNVKEKNSYQPKLTWLTCHVWYKIR